MKTFGTALLIVLAVGSDGSFAQTPFDYLFQRNYRSGVYRQKRRPAQARPQPAKPQGPIPQATKPPPAAPVPVPTPSPPAQNVPLPVPRPSPAGMPATKPASAPTSPPSAKPKEIFGPNRPPAPTPLSPDKNKTSQRLGSGAAPGPAPRSPVPVPPPSPPAQNVPLPVPRPSPADMPETKPASAPPPPPSAKPKEIFGPNRPPAPAPLPPDKDKTPQRPGSGAAPGPAPQSPEQDASCIGRLEARGVSVEATDIGHQPDARCTVVDAVHLSSMTLADKSMVEFPEKPTIACVTADTFTRFIGELLSPLAKGTFGAPVAAVWTGPGLECRSRDHIAGAKLSAHGQGLAIDIAQVKLTDSRMVSVGDPKSLWSAPFDSAVRAAACGYFHTALGPGADSFHSRHWHFDLEQRGYKGEAKFCQ